MSANSKVIAMDAPRILRERAEKYEETIGAGAYNAPLDWLEGYKASIDDMLTLAKRKGTTKADLQVELKRKGVTAAGALQIGCARVASEA